MKDIFPFTECQQYVDLLQQNITRMATNSANCKGWLIAVLTGALAISKAEVNIDPTSFMIIALIVFTFLDSFYLGQERRLRKAEKALVSKCKEQKDGWETDVKNMLFTFKDPEDCLNFESKTNCPLIKWLLNTEEQLLRSVCAFFSLSILPVYALIGFAIYIVTF